MRPGSDKNTTRTPRSKDYFDNMTATSTDKGFDGVNIWESKTGENGETVVSSFQKDITAIHNVYGFETPKTAGDKIEITGSESVKIPESGGLPDKIEPSVEIKEHKDVTPKTKDKWIGGSHLYEGAKEDFYKGLVETMKDALKNEKAKIFEINIYTDKKGEASKELENRFKKIAPEGVKINSKETKFDKWDDAKAGFKIAIYFKIPR